MSTKQEISHVEETDSFQLEDDPHRAALELNPEVAERPSLVTTLAVLSLAISFAAPVGIGFTLVAAVIVQIGVQLGDTSSITWFAGAWSIASSVSFSIAGSLSDIFGRRYLIIAGNVVSLVGAIVGGTAKSAGMIIAAQTLLGFGCGLVFVGYAGIPELLPNKWRGFGLGTTEFCIVIPWGGCAVIIANLLNSHASWRWIYYLAIIYSAIALVGTTAFYFPPRRPQRDFDKTRWQQVKELDYIGLSLYTGGLTAFLVGLTWAGTPAHPWSSASVIAPIVLGIAGLAACFAYDFTMAKMPFFPLRLFAEVRKFTVLLVLVFVSGMCFYSMSALLPQGALYMYTHDPIEIGIISLPGGLAQVLSGFILPSLSHRIKHIKTQIIVALIIQTVFIGLYSAVIPGNKPAWMAFQFFGQGCFPLVTLLCYLTAGLHVRQRDLGIASGLIGTFRSAGGSVGNAIFSTILNDAVSKQLPRRVSAAALAAGYPADDLAALIPAVMLNGAGTPGAFAAVPNATLEVQAATAEAFRQVYAYAYRRVFWATIPFGVCAIVAAFFILDSSRYLTNHVAVHLENETGPTEHLEDGEKVANSTNSDLGGKTSLTPQKQPSDTD
ncbi:uncharacterized protein BP5553_01413 [Venustampulla echinocandica]|uniref:Major facilitator superfamily (MFS) profile domain-containing protein n=1 Tax=Venustampulla echinocandica TaxID=2656787 RepID=A0A370U0Y3_9HELO|nr:uncharacterized protein BP5553_01413 [Venustampulla echinocandica]RDL41434.1 hypothetical protein BP5553_01413 [Venustampulla echinocandica]